MLNKQKKMINIKINIINIFYYAARYKTIRLKHQFELSAHGTNKIYKNNSLCEKTALLVKNDYPNKKKFNTLPYNYTRNI